MLLIVNQMVASCNSNNKGAVLEEQDAKIAGKTVSVEIQLIFSFRLPGKKRLLRQLLIQTLLYA